MDREPVINIRADGETVEARRENTTLYTHLGQLALYNHVFVVTDEEAPAGFYIWAAFHNNFDQIAQYMFENDYPMHLNMQGLSQLDLDAFDRHVTMTCADVDNGVPENWSNTDGAE